MIILLSRVGKHVVTRNRTGPLLKKNSLKVGHQKTNFLKAMSSIAYPAVLQQDYLWRTAQETEARKIF